jgi:hypothetical protein
MNNLILDPLLTMLVPVEAPDAPRLLEIRNDLMATRRGNADEPVALALMAGEQVVHVPDQGDWRRSHLEKLRDWISDDGHCPGPGARYRGLHTLFDLTAVADGGWVTKAEAEQRADVPPRQLQNELAALTKLGRKFTGATSWPIQWRKIGQTYSYRMDPAIAIWWNQGSAK